MNELNDDKFDKEGSVYEDDGIVETVIPEKEVFTPSRDYNLVGIAVIVFYFLWTALVMVGTYNLLKRENFHFTVAQAAMLSLAAEMAAFFPFRYIMKKVKYEPLKKSEEKYGFITYLKNLCIVFSLSITGSIVANMINSLIKTAGGTESKSALVSMISGDYYIMLIVVVSFGPIFEEIVMRRYLVDHTYKYGKFKAILLSGIIFGLFHGNIEQFFYAFFVGMFFAYVYIKTGRLRHSIILHMSMNIFSMIIMFFFAKAAESAGIGSLLQIVEANRMETVRALASNEEALTYLTIGFALSLAEYIMAFIGVIYILTHLNMFSVSDENEKKFPISKTILSPGMIVCYISLAALIVVPAAF